MRTNTNENDQRQDPRQRQPPPGFQNPFIHQFAGPNPFQVLNQNGPQQNVPQAAAGMPAGGAQPRMPNMTGAQPNMQPNVPPFAFPPFPFLPFMAPPPMPPQNLRLMSEEELRRIEGNERQNIEARIQCLRNIQVSVYYKALNF